MLEDTRQHQRSQAPAWEGGWIRSVWVWVLVALGSAATACGQDARIAEGVQDGAVLDSAGDAAQGDGPRDSAGDAVDGAADGAMAEGSIEAGGDADAGSQVNCDDGMMIKKSAGAEWTLGDRTFEVGRTYHFCVDLPAQVDGKPMFVELQSVNLGNASCGSLAVVLTAPSGKFCDSIGAQPGCGASYEQGRWSLTATLEWGCDRYRLYLVEI